MTAFSRARRRAAFCSVMFERGLQSAFCRSTGFPLIIIVVAVMAVTPLSFQWWGVLLGPWWIVGDPRSHVSPVRLCILAGRGVVENRCVEQLDPAGRLPQ